MDDELDPLERTIPQTVALMRELMAFVRAELGEKGAAEADEAQSEYDADGTSWPIITLCGLIIENRVPVPQSLVDHYREVGETEMAWDQDFMDDFYEDLKSLVAD